MRKRICSVFVVKVAMLAVGVAYYYHYREAFFFLAPMTATNKLGG